MIRIVLGDVAPSEIARVNVGDPVMLVSNGAEVPGWVVCRRIDRGSLLVGLSPHGRSRALDPQYYVRVADPRKGSCSP